MTSDILRLQEFLFNGLLSCDLFVPFNVVLERQFLMQSELEFNSIWQAPRAAGGKVGLGLYVEMPKLQVPKPNSLQRNLIASIGVIEERNLNMTAGAGTLVSSEEAAELCLDFMFGWLMGLSSALTPELGAVSSARDLVQGPGLVVYRASVSLRREHHATARADMPVISAIGDGTFSMANGANTAAAAIYYTTDGSFPGASNAAAARYAGPVALAAGTEVLACAFLAGFLPSHISDKIIAAQ